MGYGICLKFYLNLSQMVTDKHRRPAIGAKHEHRETQIMNTPKRHYEPEFKSKEGRDRPKKQGGDTLPLTAEAFGDFCRKSAPKKEPVSKSSKCVLGAKW